MDVLSANAASANMAGIKKVHKHLQNAGAVLIFPAGMVSAYEPKTGRIQDRPWNRLVGKLAKRYECVCLPVHVGGSNSPYFYAAGRVHPRLRTALLSRQLANKQGYALSLDFGHPITAQELNLLHSPEAGTEYLRISTDALAPGCAAMKATIREELSALDLSSGREQLQIAIAALSEFRLVEHEEFAVYCAPYHRLGVLMDLIAIAREVTFRSVGEGTFLASDSDQFDPHYMHLFLWDKTQQRIAGAYRVGFVDQIVAKHGVQGLYSRSLYEYDKNCIKQLGSALEMGRSFIHPDYQRRPVSLNLLWRGIGMLLVRNPSYHTLFGSVSISREYSDLARALIADSMLTNFHAKDFAQLVRPIKPHQCRNREWTQQMLAELANLKVLSKLIGRCDPGKTLPVLLRHYLSLNGKIVCFNVHTGFNNSLEGLIIVDVRNTDMKTLSRFLGNEGLHHFMSFHKLQEADQAAYN